MIAPAVVRWVAATLADELAGVNATLPTVPRGDSEEAPRPVTIYNAFDDHIVARNAPASELLASEWVLSVAPAEELDLAGDPLEQGDLRDSAPVVLHLSGVTVDGQDAHTLAEAHRVLRAVRQVLLHAFRQLRGGGEPLELERQWVDLPDRWKAIAKVVHAGSGQYDLMLVLPFLITDNWALSAPEP